SGDRHRFSFTRRPNQRWIAERASLGNFERVLWLAGRNSGNRRTLWSDGIHGGKKDKRDRDQDGIGRSADTNARTGSERGRKAVRSRSCSRGCGDAGGREVGGVSLIWIEALQSRSTGDRVSGTGCGGGARQCGPSKKCGEATANGGAEGRLVRS